MRIDRVKFVAAMTKRDMTQTRLAELAGVSRVTVNGGPELFGCCGRKDRRRAWG